MKPALGYAHATLITRRGRESPCQLWPSSSSSITRVRATTSTWWPPTAKCSRPVSTTKRTGPAWRASKASGETRPTRSWWTRRGLAASSPARRRLRAGDVAEGGAARGVQRPAADEHRQPAEHRPLLRTEQVVAPGKGRGEGAVPLRHVGGVGGKSAHAVTEPEEQLGRAEQPKARGGQFQGEGEPVEPNTDFGERLTVGRRDG